MTLDDLNTELDIERVISDDCLWSDFIEFDIKLPEDEIYEDSGWNYERKRAALSGRRQSLADLLNYMRRKIQNGNH